MLIKIQQIISAINLKQTGTPKELAQKLGVSERMIYVYIDIIKNDFKAPVGYDKQLKTYYFKEEGVLNLNWQEKID